MTDTATATDTDTATRRPLTIADVLEQMADSIPDKTAVQTKDRAISYRELDERANRVANHLLSRGVGRGDNVAVHAYNCVEWVEMFLGSMKISAVPINVNYKYLHDELLHVYENSESVYAVVGPQFVDAVEEIRPRLTHLRDVLVIGEDYDAALAAASAERPDAQRSEDDHYIIYTGGTTGLPKGVVWRQEDVVRGALNALRYGAPLESVEQLGEEAAATENHIRLSTCGPMMHGGSQWIMGCSFVAGQTFVLYTEPSFDAEKMLDLASQAKVTMLSVLGDAMARPIAEALLAQPDRWDLSNLLALANGAAPVASAVRQQLREALPGKVFTDSYGSSEAGTAGIIVDDGSDHAAPRFEVGADVTVLDKNNDVCPPGEVGMLARGGHLPIGYLNDPEKSAATFIERDGERWALSGDTAVIEKDGLITLLGRGSQTINSGGEKIHPEEVEGVMKSHDGVLDAAVVGTPHPRWGQMVTALVQRRPDSSVTEEELEAHARKKISNYKVPKEIIFIDRVPRTPTGKVSYPDALKEAKVALDIDA